MAAPGRRLALSLLALFALACSRDPERAPNLPGDGPAGTAETPAPAPLAIPADAPTVAFLGDSITAGLHLPADQAFPAVAQRALLARGLPFHLVDGGVSGDTSAGGRRRIAWLLKSEPDVVVVELGGNDALRGQPLAETEANLRAILESVRDAGARPLLLGMRIPPSYGADYARGFAELYPRLAEELGVPLVPYFMEGVGGVPELNLPDGLHPTPEGHERLAERLREPLESLLREG